MSDAAIKNAQAHQDALASRINTLQQELDSLRIELRDVKTFIAQWHRFAGEEDEAAPAAEEHTQNVNVLQPVDNVDSSKRPRHSNPKKELVAEVARVIIADQGSPIPRTELFRALRERGIELGGKDPEMVLSTMLWRTQKEGGPVVHLRGFGYWIASIPHETSGYKPGSGASPDTDDLDEESAKERHAALSSEIAEADRLYHQEAAPEISDREYDSLRRDLEGIEARFPELAEKGNTATQAIT